MTTQVIFKIDSKLKKAAQIKAKKEGISLADLYKSATKSYLEGKLDVGLVYYETLTPNKKTAKRLDKVMMDIKAGVGLSPMFKTGKEMNEYLDNLR